MTRLFLQRAILIPVCLVLFASGCAQQSQTGAPTAVATPAAPTTAATAAPAPQPTIAASPIPVQAEVAAFPLQAGWWDNAVCYEIFVRSFFDSNGDGMGDFNGMTQKLDYINDGNPETQGDLGANCVWLMPIMEAQSYHGYDVTDYYAVEKDYGTTEDFKRFVDEAHKRGIKVILDLVINHTSNQHPWFQEALNNPASPYRDYYIWSQQDPGYRGPWSQVVWHKSPVANEYYYGIFIDGMPDLNYRNPAVTTEAQKISAFWRTEMGIDGYRLDAIKHLIEDGAVQENTPETHAWLRGYRTFLEQQVPGTFTVGEIFDATPTILAPYYPDQLDTYFVFDLGQRILNSANNGIGRQFASAAQRVTDTTPFQRFAPFLTNHDQNRAMAALGNNPEKAKLAATALLTMPGVPFVYYGEEIGMIGAKGNPPTVDEPLRTPMQWTGEANGGFTSGTPWFALQPNTAETNVADQQDDPNSLLNHYRKLIHLHAANPALAQGDLTRLEASDDNVAAYLRQKDNQIALVVLNFGDEAADGLTLSVEASKLPAGRYQLQPLLGDAAGAELAVGDGGSIANYAPLPTVPPYTSYIFALTQ